MIRYGIRDTERNSLILDERRNPRLYYKEIIASIAMKNYARRNKVKNLEVVTLKIAVIDLQQPFKKDDIKWYQKISGYRKTSK